MAEIKKIVKMNLWILTCDLLTIVAEILKYFNININEVYLCRKDMHNILNIYHAYTNQLIARQTISLNLASEQYGRVTDPRKSWKKTDNFFHNIWDSKLYSNDAFTSHS